MSTKRKLSTCDIPFAKKVKTHTTTARLVRSQSTPRRAVLPSRSGSLPQKLMGAVQELPMRCAGPTHLEKRAVRRKEFDLEVKQKERELRDMSREDALAHAIRELDAVRALRKGLIFRAQPIHHYLTLCVRRSERKLTEPHSPSLLTARRAELHDLGRDL